MSKVPPTVLGTWQFSVQCTQVVADSGGYMVTFRETATGHPFTLWVKAFTWTLGATYTLKWELDAV